MQGIQGTSKQHELDQILYLYEVAFYQAFTEQMLQVYQSPDVTIQGCHLGQVVDVGEGGVLAARTAHERKGNEDIRKFLIFYKKTTPCQ